MHGDARIPVPQVNVAGRYAFHLKAVVPRPRIYKLEAPGETERQKWMRCLSAAAKEASRGSTEAAVMAAVEGAAVEGAAVEGGEIGRAHV